MRNRSVQAHQKSHQRREPVVRSLKLMCNPHPKFINKHQMQNRHLLTNQISKWQKWTYDKRKKDNMTITKACEWQRICIGRLLRRRTTCITQICSKTYNVSIICNLFWELIYLLIPYSVLALGWTYQFGKLKLTTLSKKVIIHAKRDLN